MKVGGVTGPGHSTPSGWEGGSPPSIDPNGVFIAVAPWLGSHCGVNSDPLTVASRSQEPGASFPPGLSASAVRWRSQTGWLASRLWEDHRDSLLGAFPAPSRFVSALTPQR